MPHPDSRKRLRIVFAGTPNFAAHHLKALLASDHQLVGVYTQPDRPAGRGKKLQASPVKQLALDAGLPVYQPDSLKSEAAQAELATLDADLMVVVAYGLLLPKAVLDTPRLGCINVHASLLPRWRGAAPIQRAIEAGDTESGVTIMQMDVGLDTGAMLVKARCPIEATDTAGDLHDRLIELGGPALLEAVTQLATGTAQPEPQDDNLSNYAPKITKAEAALDWQRPATELERQVRAFTPFPICHTRLNDQKDPIRVWQASTLPHRNDQTPGEVAEVTKDAVVVACGEGALALKKLQLPGKKAMPVADLLRGRADLFQVGDRFTLPEPQA
ncbi:methionyl-tRNA formyltransferase [Marinimicrobium agarilyticum]|uniref:methionyl-tRNA formyltransferase n=1 Tax=Marinimicrobium agarilyticum TaxID=306546 RepID=UPI0004182E55|nr:methionyl-tRNA formyltransferase [Marinimicrobium agarilyticum]